MNDKIEICDYKGHTIYYLESYDKFTCDMEINSQVKNAKRGRMRVHRIVWESFNGKIADNMIINHINGIKDDNRIVNLELCTQIENIKHSIDILGNIKNVKRRVYNKLTEQDALNVINLRQKSFTYKEIIKITNISSHTIQSIYRGKSWKHLQR